MEGDKPRPYDNRMSNAGRYSASGIISLSGFSG